MMNSATAQNKTFMENEFPYITPAPAAEPLPPAPPSELQPQPQGLQLVAPLWHTAVIVAFVLFSSYLSSSKLGGGGAGPKGGRMLLYLGTIVQDFLLLGFIWFGLWRKKVRLRDLIGGPWTVVDLLMDAALAAGFWVVSLMILVGLKFAMGLASLDSKTAMDSAKQSIGGMMPQSVNELLLFLSLAMMAGFFEEILFRGYLQKQLSALTGNAYAGLAISGALFGAAHGYQGARMMVLLAIYGMMFGVLAHFRKNLRPGMIAHAWQDGISGVAFFILTKYKLV
jgi:hypothetical protein